MERHASELTKVLPVDFVTLRECVIASFKANGPMTDHELCRSLPRFNGTDVKRIAASLPDQVTGR